VFSLCICQAACYSGSTRKVPVSKFGLPTAFLTKIFHGFPQPLQSVWIVPSDYDRFLPSPYILRLSHLIRLSINTAIDTVSMNNVRTSDWSCCQLCPIRVNILRLTPSALYTAEAVYSWVCILTDHKYKDSFLHVIRYHLGLLSL
jgi:hypothetical protein